jgi:iron complex transport system substrate-binding protein
MIEKLGAINATGDQEGWPSLTEEDAIAINPDVIISTDMFTPDAVDTHLALSGWENVTAVANGDVYLMELSNELNQPNQHVVSAMVEMAKYIYPDVFADLEDPFAVIAR